MQQNIFFEKLNQQYRLRLPFVVYRKPGEAAVAAFLQHHAELNYVEDFKESGFVFAPFDAEEKAVLFKASACESLEIPSYTGNASEPFSVHSTITETHHQEHIALVAKAVQALKEENGFKKVVLSRKEIIEVEGLDIFKAYKSILKNYPNGFCYCWYHPQVGLWLGASPETLLRLYRNKLTTMSLAGTQKFSGTFEVEWGDKELEEQQLVTDTITEELAKYSGQLNVSDAYSHKAGVLLHLRTDITAVLPANTDLGSVIGALHPTPAVCGLPKERAKEFIKGNEHYQRSFYSGFLGELNLPKVTERNTNRQNVENSAYRSTARASHLFVNLRCMEVADNEVYVYVGGGITSSSDPESEWQETINKTATMKNVLSPKIPSNIK